MAEAHDYEDRHFDADVYDKEYFEGTGSKSGYTDYSQAVGIVTDQFKIIHSLMDGKTKSREHLDVGCAYGFASQYMQQNGWKSEGIDISEFAIQKAKELHPQVEFSVGDLAKRVLTKNYGLITGVEFFEHIESKDVEKMVKNFASHSEWGFFVVNGRTSPDQDLMSIHGDHGHLNNHNMSWWIAQFAKYGEIDWETMFEFSKQAEIYNKGVHWHNRAIVVKFD